MNIRRSLVAGVLGGLTVVGAAGPAAAFTVVSETGKIGPYSLSESYESPAVTCGYGREIPPNSAYFKWMKVQPPQVRAADRIFNVREHRHVTWQFKIQRKLYPADSPDPWLTVDTSAVQGGTAYEDQDAVFSAMKVYWNARAHQDDEVLYLLRAMVIIKWYKPGGGVAGTAKLTPTYYSRKMPWETATSGADWCGSWTTSG